MNNGRNPVLKPDIYIPDGEATVLADGKNITEVSAGTYEIEVACRGDLVLSSFMVI